MMELDRFIGQKFFYADYETGIGWESRIDEVFMNYDTSGITIELSCGTRVKVSYKDYMFNKKAFYTNLKE